MTSTRVRLQIEQFEDRVTPAAFNIGQGSGVFTFNIAGYDIFQNNANFATTSSAFGFSEAEMTQPQAVDTLNGGTTMSALSDAFDGVFSFGLTNGSGGRTQTTYVDSDGIVDITPAPSSPGTNTTTLSGTILTGDFETVGSDGNTFNGLAIAQQNAVFGLSSTVPMIRSLFMVNNPTGATINQQVGIFNNLGSDSQTTIFSTSSGDATFDLDRWVVSFQAFSGTTSNDPRLLFAVQGPGTVAVPLSNTSSFVNGNDDPTFVYDLSVAPGQTVYILAFVGLYPSRVSADAAGKALFNDVNSLQNSGLLAGLSNDVLANVVNWDFSSLTAPFAVGSGGAALAQVSRFDANGNFVSAFNPFEGYTGAVAVATGDVNNDGVADTVVSTVGTSSHVKVFSGQDGSLLYSFLAYPGFDGGVKVGVGDVNNDGFADIIVGAGPGAPGGHVKVFSGQTGAELFSFFSFEGFTGGVTVAGGDVNNDGFADIVVGAGPGAPGGHVKVFSGQTGAELFSFFAFDGFVGGVSVGATDLNGDGFADIVVGAGPGAPGGHVKTFDGQTGAEQLSFFSFDGFIGGVRIGTSGSTFLVGAGPTAGPHVKSFTGAGQQLLSFFAFDPAYINGIYVG